MSALMLPKETCVSTDSDELCLKKWFCQKKNILQLEKHGDLEQNSYTIYIFTNTVFFFKASRVKLYSEMLVTYIRIHLIQKRLSSELLPCALRIVAYPNRKAPWM